MEKFIIDGQYGKLLAANNIDLQAVLKTADLPIDTFVHSTLKLSETEYFKMLNAIDEVAGDPYFPLNWLNQMIWKHSPHQFWLHFVAKMA